MHICTAHVMVGGDIANVMVRGRFNPLTWPEIGVLQFIHGEEAVFNVEPIKSAKVNASQEKQRLASIYGAAIVEQLYPGKSPVMELDMPGVTLPEDETTEPKAGAKTARRTTSIPPLTADEE